MFAAACARARLFTRPIVISSRRQDGACGTAIGAFVVINTNGWCVTAWHILQESEKLNGAANAFQEAERQKAVIYTDRDLDKKERGRRLKALPRFEAQSATNASTWFSWDQARGHEIAAIPPVDLAFFRLLEFDPSWIAEYPHFKDPTKPMEQGRSLCRIGYPFHSITPVFHPDQNNFELPAGSVPLPLFPIDGLFTRHVNVQPVPVPAPPYPLRLLETSSPGLRGQSGGPVFDTTGAIWGIQSRTMHFPLGFSPPVPDGKPNEKEHQFLNVGWAVHVETLIGAMQELKIDFAIADH